MRLKGYTHPFWKISETLEPCLTKADRRGGEEWGRREHAADRAGETFGAGRPDPGLAYVCLRAARACLPENMPAPPAPAASARTSRGRGARGFRHAVTSSRNLAVIQLLQGRAKRDGNPATPGQHDDQRHAIVREHLHRPTNHLPPTAA